MKNRLLVKYRGEVEKDLGEVCDVNELTKEQLREAVCDWMQPTSDHPFEGYILKDADGGFHLRSLYVDYKIVDGKTGAVIEQY